MIMIYVCIFDDDNINDISDNDNDNNDNEDECLILCLQVISAVENLVDSPTTNVTDRAKWKRVKITCLKSLIWKSLPLGFSKYRATTHDHIVICEKCASLAATIHNCEIDYGTSKSTSNVKRHVQVYHKPEYDVFLVQQRNKRQLSSSTGSNSVARSFPVSDSTVSLSQKAHEVKLLLKVIVRNHLPLAIVESAVF
jgi:hypothetical protein